MPKKYNEQDYQGSYSGAARSLGFKPVKAIDESKQFIQKGQERDRDLKTYASYLQRQGAVANSQLNADRAKSNANFAAVKGLLSMTQQGVGMVQKMGEQQEAARLKAEKEAKDEFQSNQMMESIVGIGMDEDPTIAEGVVERSKDLAIGVAAEGQAINESAGDSELTPGQQNNFRQSATQVQYTGVKGNVYSATAGHDAYVRARMDELEPAMRPRTEGEAAALIRQFNQDYIKASGVLDSDMSRELFLEKGAATIINNTSNLARSTVSAAVKADQEANSQALGNTLYQAVSANESGEAVWQAASDGEAFGNTGFEGRSAASNAAALEKTLAAYVANEDVMGIQRLKDVDKVPGNPGAGTLGDAYGPEIDKALEAARQGKVQEWNRGQQERDMVATQMIQDYYEDPSSANKEDLVANLMRLGPKGRAEANRMITRGLNNDPSLEIDVASRAASGKPYSELELKEFMDSGLIREEVYTKYADNSKGAQIDKEVSAAVRGKGAQIRSMIEVSGPDVTNLTPVQKQQIQTRAAIFQKDLEQRVNSEAKAAGILDNPLELEKLTQDVMAKMAQESQYKLVPDPAGGLGAVKWAASINPSYVEEQTLTVTPGSQMLTGLSTEALISQTVIPRSELSHTDDFILSQEDTLAAASIMDGAYSDRIIQTSKHMGISPKALVEGQLQRYNQPSLLNFKEQQGSTVTDTVDLTKASGYSYIQNDLGFPARGSAYLTSAIDHESAWEGEREWGQVEGDGTNRNGGLISWASWHDNPARLGAIERHFGRPIGQISEREQLNYMKREMSKSYGAAYRIFMDPNASSADLQWAVSSYWGFDPAYTGSRWTDAERYIKNPPIKYTQ